MIANPSSSQWLYMLQSTIYHALLPVGTVSVPTYGARLQLIPNDFSDVYYREDRRCEPIFSLWFKMFHSLENSKCRRLPTSQLFQNPNPYLSVEGLKPKFKSITPNVAKHLILCSFAGGGGIHSNFESMLQNGPSWLLSLLLKGMENCHPRWHEGLQMLPSTLSHAHLQVGMVAMST